MPNFCSLACLEVARKFVGGVVGRGGMVGSKWLPCLTSTKLLLSCFELSYVGFGQYSIHTYIYSKSWFKIFSLTLFEMPILSGECWHDVTHGHR